MCLLQWLHRTDEARIGRDKGSDVVAETRHLSEPSHNETRHLSEPSHNSPCYARFSLFLSSP